MDQAREDVGGTAATSTPVTTHASTEGRSIVAVIPAFNEAKTIASVIRGATEYVDTVVVVDDASTDDTATVAERHAEVVLHHPTNLGVGAALETGYRFARRGGYDLVVQLDGDGQHEPSRIPELLHEYRQTGASMVIGSRWLNRTHREYHPIRRLGIAFFTAEANLLGGTNITDVSSGFRVYEVSMLNELEPPSNRHWALEQTLEAARKGYTITEVSIPMVPDPEGSQFDLPTYALYPLRMLISTLKVVLFR